MPVSKTLVVLSPGFAQDENDSTCLPFLQSLIKWLAKQNDAVRVVVIAFQYPYVSDVYEWNGVTVYSLNGRNKGKLLRLKTWLKARRLLNHINFNTEIIGLLNLWVGECALVGCLFARRRDVNHYSWILGQDARPGNRYFPFLNIGPQNLIAVSDFVAEEFEKNYGLKPQHIIPVGIDASLFASEPQQRDIDVLGAGSLIKLKRYDLFIEVILSLKKKHPQIKACICGGGREYKSLEKIIGQHQLHDNVVLLGELPHKEVLQLMQRSKVFLHTSAYEGYGAVINEALYAGASVVSFNKPMKTMNEKHHLVRTKSEAEILIHQLLSGQNPCYESVLEHSIEEVSKKVFDLFA